MWKVSPLGSSIAEAEYRRNGGHHNARMASKRHSSIAEVEYRGSVATLPRPAWMTSQQLDSRRRLLNAVDVLPLHRPWSRKVSPLGSSIAEAEYRRNGVNPLRMTSQQLDSKRRLLDAVDVLPLDHPRSPQREDDVKTRLTDR